MSWISFVTVMLPTTAESVDSSGALRRDLDLFRHGAHLEFDIDAGVSPAFSIKPDCSNLLNSGLDSKSIVSGDENAG